MLEASTIPKQDRSLHVLNRLAFGPRPGDLEGVDSVGADKWIQQQLHPESIEIPQVFIDQIRTYSTLHMSPVELFVDYQKPVMQARREAKQAGGDKADLKGATKDERIKQRVVMREAVEARLYRAIFGPRQLQEVMTAFWFNHFNIFAGKGLDMVWTGAFEEQAIRPHTMGRFRDLLGATAHHPAMLFYLDNWQNTAPNSPGAKGKFDGINENYARELMELHTLGVNGGYSQQDVIALAHILTGWGLPPGRGGGGGGGGGQRRAQMEPPMFPPGFMPRGLGYFFRRRQMAGPGQIPLRVDPSGFYFDPSRHDPGSKYFLGQTIEGGGEREGEEALDILARSPQTATHLSFQLAQYFIADAPPPALVHRMAQRYLATDGDIRAVLELMFTSSEFWDQRYYAAKFKTPYEYVVSCVRATGVPVSNFRPLYGTIQLLGMPLYGCQTPNGYDMTQESWLNPDAMMTRLSFATALANGNLPLLNPPFEEDGAPGPNVVPKNGRYKAVNFGHPNNVKMDPVDPAAVTSAMGGGLSPNTANAVETAPPQLRAALVLGSPEFMKR